jgi:hypothetical protein
MHISNYKRNYTEQGFEKNVVVASGLECVVL